MINYNQENISQSKKKNSKYKTGIDYNEENKSMENTKEVCCSQVRQVKFPWGSSHELTMVKWQTCPPKNKLAN